MNDPVNDPVNAQQIRRPAGFGPGYTALTSAGEPGADVGFDFGILVLRAGETFEPPPDRERALLLLSGEVSFAAEPIEGLCARTSLFDEDPAVLHVARGCAARVTAHSDCELALLAAENPRPFAPLIFRRDSMLEPSEHRGKGQLDDAAYRIVRTVFDGRNRGSAALVLGEVITFPGRWSSYPPHHHPQPEIYHYRFTDPRGFGHGELGDTVLKVRQYDTVKIFDGQDHAQVAAPGYGMYYLWAIRHLPGRPYTVPDFTEEHRWLMEPNPPIWRPSAPGEEA